MKEFDPLQNSEDFSLEIAEENKKRHIRNILKSYVGMFDVFSETIQNALDSIERRQKKEDVEGNIVITIDLNKNQYSISDNGTGFDEKEFFSFLAPEVSFNKGPHLTTRGNKGVGATYLAFAYNKLIIETKNPNFEAHCEYLNGRNWIEDKDGSFVRPKVRSTHEINSTFDDYFKQGASFTVEFGCTYSRPKGLNYFQAETPSQWGALLRCKTPLGLLDKNKRKIICSIKVIKDDQEDTAPVEITYPYPHTIINSSLDINEYVKWQLDCIKKKRDASNIPAKYRKRSGIFRFYTTEDLETIIKKSDYEEKIKPFDKEYSIWAYGYFAHSTDLWDVINDNKFSLRKNYRVLKGGLQIANNTMIQGENIVIPLSSNIGYQNQCHVIVHFINADPDLGRKGFQPELKEAAEKIASSIVGDLKGFRTLLKENTQSKDEDEKELSLHEWLKKQEEHKQKFPLNLSSEHFFQPKRQISILSTPQSEQDVIALFNQLIAGGVIRSIELLGTNQNTQYDGVFVYKRSEDENMYLYDSKTNPLGIEDHTLLKDFVSQPKVLEYKRCLDNLIQEFHNEEKRAQDISLAIAWTMGDKWKEDFECISLLDENNHSHRKYHGVTHQLINSTSKIDVIILSELVKYLEDPDSSQKFQEENYGDID